VDLSGSTSRACWASSLCHALENSDAICRLSCHTAAARARDHLFIILICVSAVFECISSKLCFNLFALSLSLSLSLFLAQNATVDCARETAYQLAGHRQLLTDSHYSCRSLSKQDGRELRFGRRLEGAGSCCRFQRTTTDIVGGTSPSTRPSPPSAKVRQNQLGGTGAIVIAVVVIIGAVGMIAVCTSSSSLPPVPSRAAAVSLSLAPRPLCFLPWCMPRPPANVGSGEVPPPPRHAISAPLEACTTAPPPSSSSPSPSPSSSSSLPPP
jgi:hypothetical protein